MIQIQGQFLVAMRNESWKLLSFGLNYSLLMRHSLSFQKFTKYRKFQTISYAINQGRKIQSSRLLSIDHNWWNYVDKSLTIIMISSFIISFEIDYFSRFAAQKSIEMTVRWNFMEMQWFTWNFSWTWSFFHAFVNLFSLV